MDRHKPNGLSVCFTTFLVHYDCILYCNWLYYSSFWKLYGCSSWSLHVWNWYHMPVGSEYLLRKHEAKFQCSVQYQALNNYDCQFITTWNRSMREVQAQVRFWQERYMTMAGLFLLGTKRLVKEKFRYFWFL